MKKWVGIIALIMVLFLFCGCEENDDTLPDNVESMIKDEQTWNDAFDKLKYDNYTLSYRAIQDANGGNDSVGEMKYTEDCLYFQSRTYGNNEAYREGYIRKIEEGYQNFSCSIFKNYHTSEGDYFIYSASRWDYKHYLTIEEALKDPKIWVVTTVDDEYMKEFFAPFVLEISFSEKFKYFTYDAELETYSYDGEISASLPNDKDYEVKLKDSSIQFKDGKVIALKYTMLVEGGYFEYAYTNIGTTGNITIPKDIEETALKN